MNLLTTNGHLGRDAKIYSNASGTEFITFSLAVTIFVKKDEEKTVWYDVIVPNYLMGRYRNMVPHLTKGRSVIVTGELDPSIRLDNNGVSRLQLTLSATSIQFNSMGGRNNNGTSQTPQQAAKQAPQAVPNDIPMVAASAPAPAAAPSAYEDDDLPF